MQPVTLAGEQLVIHGFARQRVAEAASVAFEHQDLVGDSLAQRLADLTDRASGHGGQQPIIDRAADQGCLTQHGLDRSWKPADACEDGVANGGGECTRTCPDREQLLGVERVAVGAGQNIVDDRVSRHPTGDARQKDRQLTTSHPGDVHVLHHRVAGQLVEHRLYRVTTMDVVGAVTDHQRNFRRAQVAGQERDEVAGRPVGPVQVLDRHEQPGRAFAHGLEQGQGLLEDRPRTHVAPATSTGQQRQQLGCDLVQQRLEQLCTERRPQPAENLDERSMRDPDVAQIDAAGHHAPAATLLQPVAQLIDQAGFAHPGVAADQNELGLALCSLDRTLQLAQLGVAPDERRTRNARLVTGSVWTSARASAGLPGIPITMVQACRSPRRRASGHGLNLSISSLIARPGSQ